MRCSTPIRGDVCWVGPGAVLAAPAMAQQGHTAHRPPQQHTLRKSQNRPPQHQQKPPKHARKTAANGGHPNGGARNPQGMARDRRIPRRSIARSRTTIRTGRGHIDVPPRSGKNSASAAARSAEKIRREVQPVRNLLRRRKQDLDRRKSMWGRMTPQQQNHVKNDVLPKWRQMSPDRRQAIRQRLRVLQNMPESARNQRLNDPEFTRGMSDEDKATLRDLSHLHVGGAPDPPGE